MSSSVGKNRTLFTLKARPGSEVSVAGSFNNWQPGECVLFENEAGSFSCAEDLPPGEHEYKYSVNGEWKLDPHAPWRSNHLGTVNNVLWLWEGTTDFQRRQCAPAGLRQR